MKTISFVNPNFQQGPTEFNAYYLPYSTGILWAYAAQFTAVTDQWQLGEFVWRREDIATAAQRLSQHDMVGFSTYIWNKSYNYALAAEIKRLNPGCITVFGGPEPPVTKADLFTRYPFMDMVVLQEGEHTLCDLLLCADPRSVPGLLINDQGQLLRTPARSRIDDLDQLPSPYLTGVFAQLMADNPTVEWNAVIETNRGCPYACTFCDWGSLTYSKVKKFDLDRAVAELEWVGRNHIGFISIADANFGIFPDRDNVIADKLIDIQQRHGWPKSYTISWAKNQKSEVISIVKRLVDNGARQGLTVSVQSLDDGVLEIIKRKNMAINQIDEIFEQCDRQNIPVITELILGLPGETLLSWQENYYKLFRADNHTGITTYNAQLLENAEMNLTQRAEHEIETVVVRDYLCGANDSGELGEGVEIVKSTRDMPHEDLIEAQLFTWYMNTFHINGLSNWLSRFAHAQGTDYRDFYEDLYQWLLGDAWFVDELAEIKQHYQRWFATGKVDHPPLGKIEIYGMNLGQRTSISIHANQLYDRIFSLLEQYYLQRFPEHADYAHSLFQLQRGYFLRHDQLSAYPMRIKLDHDIMGHVQSAAPLHQPREYLLEFSDDAGMSLTRFCENLWFGRRRNFGKAVVTVIN